MKDSEEISDSLKPIGLIAPNGVPHLSVIYFWFAKYTQLHIAIYMFLIGLCTH